jgi:hypothetical protein
MACSHFGWQVVRRRSQRRVQARKYRSFATKSREVSIGAKCLLWGHLQTCPALDGMSASPLKADIGARGQHVPNLESSIEDPAQAAALSAASQSSLRVAGKPARSMQLVEQRLRLSEIGRVEPLGDPAVDRCEEVVSLAALPSGAPKSGEADGTSKFE